LSLRRTLVRTTLALAILGAAGRAALLPLLKAAPAVAFDTNYRARLWPDADVARAAIEAVARVATANGHAVAVPPEARAKLQASHRSTKRSGGPSVWVFIAPLLFVVAAIVVTGRLTARRSRRRQA